jgi:pseudomonalisin
MGPLRVTVAWVLLSASVCTAVGRYEVPNSVPARATTSRWLRKARPDESLEMSVTLRLQHTDELAALLTAQQDPHSPRYHQWLTPDEFATRFAPAPADYTAVVAWLQGEGFRVHPKVNGARIDFSGTVASVERSFGVRMQHYSHRGRAPLANENPAQLPSEFVDAVDFVRLNTFPLAEPLVHIHTAATFVTAMAPSDMYIAYDMQPLLDVGVTGSGQTIAVVARSDFKAGDITSFEQQFGVPAHLPEKVFPSTNPGIGAPNGVCQGITNQSDRQSCLDGEEGEVVLDTEWAMAMAPGATVLVDISGADIDESLLDIVTNHPEAKTVTMSLGACERLDRSDLSLFGHMYTQAAAQGQTVTVSTGDDGADGCQDGRGRSVNVLASDAMVTAVGGTALDPGFDAAGNATAYVSETVWNDSDGASGGGASTLVAKPGYQSVPGVPEDGMRDQPDVALLASPSNAGYFVVIEGSVAVAGGTSAATPSWAGMVALLNDALHLDGSGPLNATLYALGRQQYADNGAAVFHDVTVGNNSFNQVVGYSAAPGYDLCSGLGSPDVALLAHTLNTMLNPPTPTPTPPASVCVGDCNNDQSVNVNEILMLVNIAVGAENLPSCTAADANHDGQITIDEILVAVNNALNGCGS